MLLNDACSLQLYSIRVSHNCTSEVWHTVRYLPSLLTFSCIGIMKNIYVVQFLVVWLAACPWIRKTLLWYGKRLTALSVSATRNLVEIPPEKSEMHVFLEVVLHWLVRWTVSNLLGTLCDVAVFCLTVFCCQIQLYQFGTDVVGRGQLVAWSSSDRIGRIRFCHQL